MTFVFILTLIILGVVAASGLVENKIPQSKTGLDFIKPHAAWIGLVSMVLGLYFLLKFIFNLGTILKYVPIALVIIKLVSYLIMVILGFLLAQELLRQVLGKNDSATESIDKMVGKFTPLKEKLGLAAIGAGLLNLLLAIT